MSTCFKGKSPAPVLIGIKVSQTIDMSSHHLRGTICEGSQHLAASPSFAETFLLSSFVILDNMTAIEFPTSFGMGLSLISFAIAQCFVGKIRI
jgi:hypothetical protein